MYIYLFYKLCFDDCSSSHIKHIWEKLWIYMLVCSDPCQTSPLTVTLGFGIKGETILGQGIFYLSGDINIHPPHAPHENDWEQVLTTDWRGYILLQDSDTYCWICRKDGIVIPCQLCPRVYHLKCLGLTGGVREDWTCVECEVKYS